jgi:hypothetical protein
MTVALTDVTPADSSVFSMVRQFWTKRQGLSGKESLIMAREIGGKLTGAAGQRVR